MFNFDLNFTLICYQSYWSHMERLFQPYLFSRLLWLPGKIIISTLKTVLFRTLCIQLKMAFPLEQKMFMIESHFRNEQKAEAKRYVRILDSSGLG